jgi:TolB-like protein
MGQVYRAHDPRLGRDVALKVLPPGVTTDPDRLARFRREARALAAANHPHIVTIFSIEEDHGDPFLTMEVVEGRSLDRALAERGLPLPRYFEIGLALADALSAAHRKGIVHRDLKPANIMIADDGLVKVLDFGLARETAVHDAGDNATSSGLTQAGIVVGTAPYMSPEQIEAKPLDHRSDIFSLGVVLYEMASGRRPFTGDSGFAVMSSILRDRPRPLNELREDVPEAVWRLTSRCLEKLPADRVQTAQEVHAELKALQRAWESGEAPAAGPPAPRPSDLRVAVLPFTSRGGADAEALAERLTDEITAGLSRFSYLRVVSRHEADVARGHSADALAAERVGARYLLEGAVRAAGTTLRLTVRLVDASTNAHIWAQTYDRALGGDAFALQDDLTARVVATVGDTNGVLARSLATTLRERDAGELTADELVMRFFGYAHHFRPDEHRVLRDAFPRALVKEPGHALGWACLAILYEHEYTQRLDAAPETRARCAEAGQRSIELDATCQTGWRVLAGLRFFARDLNGLRVAVERSVSLNPLHTTHLAYVGQLRAYAGDWDRGIELVMRAIDLNPHHAGWLYFALATDEYRKGHYDRALMHAKRSNLPQFVWTPLCVAVSAGQLGLAADARDAVDEIRRNHPACVDPATVRALWSVWQWDGALVDRLIDGFEKALVLAG